MRITGIASKWFRKKDSTKVNNEQLDKTREDENGSIIEQNLNKGSCAIPENGNKDIAQVSNKPSNNSRFEIMKTFFFMEKTFFQVRI